GYLLGRGHFQFFGQIARLLADEGLTDEEFYVLSTLTLKRIMTSAEMDAGMAGIPGGRGAETIRSLVERGLAAEAPVVAELQGTEYMLTERGRDCALRLIAAAKAVESQVLERLGSSDAQVLKSLLVRLLGVIDPSSGALWQDRNGKARS
ncbi:MAG TPA: MarR family winged helix-turn-helix transcriptional regulator, partial [Solimonas sp.]|nr:MarR family winged helix-turn-helix transcriptional regulator [Solimonas sp.]